MSLIRLAVAVTLAAAPFDARATTIVDGSFEAKGATVADYCYDGFAAGGNAACAPSVWSGSGVIHSGSGPWGGTTTPFGSTFAFVQGTEALSQIFAATATGKLELTWFDAGRTNNGGPQSYKLSVAGSSADLGTFTTNGGAFTARSSTQFSVQAGQFYTVVLQGLSNEDRTSFIDNVALAAVPEPASWALMLAGFGLVGVAVRRRSAVVAA